MKTVHKFVTLTLVLLALSAAGFSQAATGETPLVTTQNLVRGVIGSPGSNNSWANFSVLDVIPGSGLFPITSASTVFYYGFTAGTQADISNMVVYTTARGSLTITAVTPVTLGGVSNPSINLASTGVCPVPPSVTTPCIVRFDPTTLTMSPGNDYYFMVYFANDSNNSGLGATQANNPQQSTVAGTYFGGDFSHLTVGQSIPGKPNGGATFLMYVMNN